MRIWGKIWKDNHLLRDTIYEDDTPDTRTHKVFHALEEICYELDLSVPVWLDLNVRQFKKHAQTRFTQDNFIEEISFDCLEFQVVEED